MGLSVTVLGCSGSYAAPDGACSGYLVRSDSTSVWLDAGPGTLGALQRYVDLAVLDAVVVTHVHPDHWLELPVLYNACKWYLHRDGLPVYATSEIRTALEAFGHALEPVFAVTTIDESSRVRIGDIDLRFSRTDHPVETYATRCDHGDATFVYSSDTGPGWSLSKLGPDIDLALCEATHLHADWAPEIPHLSAHLAGADGRASKVRRLVLTHLSPLGDPDKFAREAMESFGAPVEIAKPHERYDV